MKRFLASLLLTIVLTYAFGQNERNSSLYLEGQYNHTISDATKGNNPWAIGVGLQLLFRQHAKLQPSLELTADEYLEDDKLNRLYPDNTSISPVEGMVNFLAGGSYHPLRNAYVSFLAGPSLVGGLLRLGLKPSVGFYFPANQKFTAKISYINVLQREPRSKQNFKSVSLAIGVKLY